MEGDKHLANRLRDLSVKIKICSDTIKRTIFEEAEANNKKIGYFTISTILQNCHNLEDISSAMVGLSEYVKIHDSGQ